ncbi:MAG: G8 domain-containing protein, partial [Pirellulales bacterium]|nr:G8 domain-containing protein [Pirellulales bacterium]
MKSLSHALRIFWASTIPLVCGSTLQAQFPLPQSSPLDLLPANEATHVVESSGDWTDPNTWQGGQIPNDLAKVLIPAGKTLTIDTTIETRIKIIRNEGKLVFSTSSNTALNVETIVQGMTGELEIGTSQNPLPAGLKCTITIIDAGNIA